MTERSPILDAVTDARDGKRAERVRRLARRKADAPPAAGIRAILPRRSWKSIKSAGNRLNSGPRQRAYRGALADWAAAGAPDDARREVLAEWAGGEERFARDVMSMATTPGADHAALTAFCLRNGIAPQDPADRALFFALTGQTGQRLALDPDGSLLADASRLAGPSRRAALREAMTSDASLDVVRLVAGSGPLVTELMPEERERFTRLLADRRDWAALWRLALELPVPEAVAAVRLADPGWRPATQRDRDLFGLLAEASPADVRRAREAMDQAEVIHLEVPGKVRAGALSDDGRRVAVWTHDSSPADPRSTWPEAPSPGTVSVYSLPDGALVARHAVTIWHEASLAYSGGTLAAFTARLREAPWAAWLYHCPEDGPVELTYHDDHMAGHGPAGEHGTVAMAAFGDGFVTARLGNLLGFHDSLGREVETVRYSSPWTDYASHAASIAVDHRSGRIAVMRAHYGILLDGQRRTASQVPVVGRLRRPVDWRGICLRGGDHLVVSEGMELELWNLAGYRAERSYWDDDRPNATLRTRAIWDVTWIWARDEICCVWYRDDSGGPNVHYVDGATLRPVTGERELSGKRATVLFGSADATRHALGGDGYADIAVGDYQAVGKLADSPPASWRPDDLRIVERAGRLGTGHHEARPLYQLLRSCLERRLGDDEPPVAR